MPTAEDNCVNGGRRQSACATVPGAGSAVPIPDGTVRLQGQQPMRASEELYRASFEQAAVGILHTSLDGHILECNECFARIVGYTPEELIGSSFQAITPPEDRGAGNTALVRLLSGEAQTVSFEKRYLRRDGTLTWVLLTISIQHDEQDRSLFFLTMVQDINARKQAEEMLLAPRKR